ncbi:DedA family protein [Leptolyngbya sp. NIES-2104]|uniref:DedA family protein n=1 Tax=Leptolyngbya sp. NIES-2104 TaxID=1552121 RepID=UPI0006EC6128|nr:DedA family protein [Leptolyngbya sp. NIES-2104]GAP95942.1 alkaline phosphatase like protein [Leptolyngbya sp. NIES-2104]
MSAALVEWITKTMESLGYLGIGFLMFAENLFPPIPSELIMPLAGFTVSKGQMNFQYAVLAGVVGTILGTLLWYYGGLFIGEKRIRELADRYGKWIGVTGNDIDKVNRWFYRHGTKAVLFGRLVPGVRTLISLPAGISGMRLMPFLVYSTIGTTVWTFALTYAGYVLGDNYELVDEYLAPVSKVVLAILVVVFIVWLVRRRQKNS